MWIDNVSLVRLEEVAWTIGGVPDDLDVAIRDDEFFEPFGLEEVWGGASGP